MGDGIVGSVKVKPLVWAMADWSTPKDETHIARTDFGDYRIKSDSGTYYILGPWNSPLRYRSGLVVGKLQTFGTIDAAKAAAQADYEARIMAALDVQPITVQDAARVPEVQALIEASYENGLSDALGIVASIGYGATEDVDRGHEDAYRAIEKHLADWKASAAALRAIAEGRE